MRHRKNFLILVLVLFVVPSVALGFLGPSAGQNPGSGSGAFSIDSNRNIGFGASDGTPSTAPPEEGVFGKVFTIASTTNPGIALKNLNGSGRNYVWFSRNSGRLALWDATAQSVRLVVHPSGNIGIASSTVAAEKLHVFGNVKADGAFIGALSGTVVAANITPGVFSTCGPCSSGAFSFPASLGIATSSNVGLPQSLSVYGGGYFSGSVGIGEIAPIRKLVVKDSGVISSFVSTNTSAYLDLIGTTEQLRVGVFGGIAGLADGTGTTPFLSVAGGNVGIGTVSPTAGLEVKKGSGGNYADFKIQATHASAAAYYTVFKTDYADQSFSINQGGTNILKTYGFNDADELGIGVLGYEDTIYIDTSGNVGIATTTPASPLTVAGIIESTTGGFKFPDDTIQTTAGGGGGGGAEGWSRTGTNVHLTTSTDSVGIGTASPGTKLTVSATDAAVATTASQTNISAFTGNGIRIQATGAGTNSQDAITYQSESSGGGAAIALGRGGSWGTFLSFYTNSDANSGGGNIIERMRINQAGNVGIGTISPSEKLTIASGGKIATYRAGNDRRGVFYTDSSGTWIESDSVGSDPLFLKTGGAAGSIRFNLGASEKMRIDTTGNVGIATTTPAYNLDVWGTGRFLQPLFVGDPAADAHAATKFYVDDAVTGGAGTGSFTTLSVTGTSTLATTSGRVGIGTTSPGAKLEVAGGNIIITDDDAWIGASSGANIFWNDASGSSVLNAKGALTINMDSNNNDADTQAIYFAKNKATAGSTGAIMTILESGNVGIGTIGPSEKLDVSGDILFNYNALIAGQATQTTNVDHIWVDDGNAAYGGNAIGTWHFSHDQGYKAEGNSALVAGNIWMLNNNDNYIAGNVGIATTTPAYNLDVWGTGRFLQPLFVGDPAADAHAATKKYVDDTVTAGDNDWAAVGGGDPTLAGDVYHTGNVGIGTVSPGYALDVVGEVYSQTGSGTAKVYFGNTGTYIERTGSQTIFQSDNRDIHLRTVDASEDIIFTANSIEAMRIDATNQNVGIATTTPVYNLDVAGTSRFTQPVIVADPVADAHAATRFYVDDAVTTGISANTDACSGDATCEMNGATLNGGNITNVNKLTVTTIDPLYEINGVKYATYVASIVGGVKEEYVGKAQLSRSGSASWLTRIVTRNDAEEYEHIIDFTKIEEGSDLWVWYKSVDFSKDNVDALITPYGQAASIYYRIDGEKIIFSGDKSAEFSYRLIGKRFDWRNWPTYALDQSEKPSFSFLGDYN